MKTHSFMCDGCKETVTTESTSLPKGWFSYLANGGGQNVFAVRGEVCKRACLERAFIYAAQTIINEANKVRDSAKSIEHNGARDE